MCVVKFVMRPKIPEHIEPSLYMCQVLSLNTFIEPYLQRVLLQTSSSIIIIEFLIYIIVYTLFAETYL